MARSPDLSPFVFFPLGLIKNKAFHINLHDIQQLKTNITNPITDATRASLKKVARNVLKKTNSSVNANGDPFKHQTENSTREKVIN